MLLQRHLGFVLAAVLAVGSSAFAAGSANRDVRVVVSNANVRAEPSIQSRVLHQASRGTVLRVVEELGEWYLVTASGMQPGYVSKTVVETVAAAQVDQTTAAPGIVPRGATAPPAATPSAAAPTTAPKIAHDPLACVGADDHPLMLADVMAQAQARLHRTRVYFKAHQFPDWYYVDMKVPDQPHYQAFLPQPLPETERVDYYIHALDTTLETARTDQYEPVVSRVGCVRPNAAKVEPKDATQIVIGGTKEGQSPIPPGFSKSGIIAFVAYSGVVATGMALTSASSLSAATTAGTSTTAAAGGSAGSGAAGGSGASATGGSGAGAAGSGGAGAAGGSGGAAGGAAGAGAGAAAGGAAAGAAAAGGIGGVAIAGIVAGGAAVLGVGGYFAYDAVTDATDSLDDNYGCLSASEIASESQGTWIAVGSETICTNPWYSCGSRGKSWRLCISNFCRTSGCSIYWESNGGSRSTCSLNCGGGDYSGYASCLSTTFCN